MGRLGTASSYECSLNSLGLDTANFRDITPEWLEAYEKRMLKAGRSVSTVGIYLRPLRFLFNRAIRDGITSYYPFGIGKYEIPTSENTKRPLSSIELQRLAGYSGNTLYKYYRDFFILSYYLSGLNFVDLLTLQRKQLKGNALSLVRAKTRRTSRKQKEILLKLNDEAMDIISRHGTGQGKYIFDIIKDDDSPEIIRQRVRNFISNTNQVLKKIAKEISINSDISTVYARHSAASHGLKAGISLAMISKSLGHSNIAVTSNYLSTIDDEEQALADALKINHNGQH
jgi:integrase